MNPCNFLKDLQYSGVNIWLEDGKLKCKGPSTALTAEVVTRLKEIMELMHKMSEEIKNELPKIYTKDLIEICHHPDGGAFTIIGWRPGHKPVTFPIEHGAHAGPGAEETNSFALLPSDAVLSIKSLCGSDNILTNKGGDNVVCEMVEVLLERGLIDDCTMEDIESLDKKEIF